jgi:hypothetical protein
MNKYLKRFLLFVLFIAAYAVLSYAFDHNSDRKTCERNHGNWIGAGEFCYVHG